MTTDLRCRLLLFEFLSFASILFGECRTNIFDSKTPKSTTEIVQLSLENERSLKNANYLSIPSGTTYRTTSYNSSSFKNNITTNLRNGEINKILVNTEISQHNEKIVTDCVNDDGFSTSRNDYLSSKNQLKRIYLSPNRRMENLTNDDSTNVANVKSKDKKTYDVIDDKKRDKSKALSSVEENTYVPGEKAINLTEEKLQLVANTNGMSSSSSRGKLKFQLSNAITESPTLKESGNVVEDSLIKADIFSELPIIKYEETNVPNSHPEFSSLHNSYFRKNENNTRLPKTTNFQHVNSGSDDGYKFETRFEVDTERDYSKFEDKQSKYLLNEPENSIDKIRNFNMENNANLKVRNIVKKPQGFTTTTISSLEMENFRKTVSRFSTNTNQKQLVHEYQNGTNIPSSTEVNLNSISKNEILKKPIKLISAFNSRRKVSNVNTITTSTANSSNEYSLPTTSTVWALASLKTTNLKIQKQSAAEIPKKDNVEITPSFASQKILSINTIKPFVSWSTKLQKTTVANQKDLLTTTLKSFAEIDSETIFPLGYMEDKILSVNNSKQPVLMPLSYIENNTSTNEMKIIFPDFIFNDTSMNIDNSMKMLVKQNETMKNSSININLVPNTMLVHFPENSPIISNNLNYSSENDTKFTNDINKIDFNEMNTIEEKRNENENDKRSILTFVSTTSFESRNPEIVLSSAVLNEKIKNFSTISGVELPVLLETTTVRSEFLTNSTTIRNANISDSIKYPFTEPPVRNNDSVINFKSVSSINANITMGNTKSAVIVDSIESRNNNTVGVNENHKFETNTDLNRIENFPNVNMRNEDNKSLNVKMENEYQNSSENIVSVMYSSVDILKNGSIENSKKFDSVTHVTPIHEIYIDPDNDVTPVLQVNKTFLETRLQDVVVSIAANASVIQQNVNPMTTTSTVIIPETIKEIPIISQPFSSTTSTSSVISVYTEIESLDESDSSDIITLSPSSSTSKMFEKDTGTEINNEEIEIEFSFEKDRHFTTAANNQNFPSNIGTTHKNTSPYEPSTILTPVTTEINVKHELPAVPTFKPKLPPESVPGYLMLFFKSTFAEVCQTSALLRENLFRFITQRSGRVQSKDQVIMVIDPEQCKEPDHLPRLIPVALYLVDDFGTYDKTLIDEIKTLLEDDNLNNYTLPIHQIIYRENLIPDNSRLIAVVIITSIAAVCLVLLIFLMCTIRNRQKLNYGQRCTPVSIDDYNLDNISEFNSIRRKGKDRNSKRSYGNPTFDDPTAPSKTLTYAGLLKACENRRSLDEEFSQIPIIPVKPEELPLGAEIKNRYANVIPLPETRVSLSTNMNCSDSMEDYINANYVEGHMGREKFYIACQAPLQNTVEDFWKMVWKEQTKVIIMLTGLTENGVEKCADYLPPSEVLDCHRLFGDFQVTLKKRDVKEKYVISCLQLKNMVNNLWREVIHLWYTSWPTQGVPIEQSSIIALLIEARAYMRNSRGPHIVHCSPGTGRTGTIITIDICIRDYESSRSVNIPLAVTKLRRCRAGAVQTKEQYAFIYKVLSLYAKKLNVGTALDSI